MDPKGLYNNMYYTQESDDSTMDPKGLDNNSDNISSDGEHNKGQNIMLCDI